MVLGIFVIPVVGVTMRGSWGFGWEALVAIGTLSLAAVTFGVVLFTARMANRTGQLAQETRKLAVETAAEVRASWRPVVMVKGTHASLSRTSETSRDGTFALRFENSGRGPAMNAIAAVVTYDGKETLVSEVQDVGTLASESVASEMFSNVRVVPVAKPSGVASHWVLVEYGDLAGTLYYSEMRFDYPGDIAFSEPRDIYGNQTEVSIPLAHVRHGQGTHPIANLHARWGNASEVPVAGFPELWAS